MDKKELKRTIDQLHGQIDEISAAYEKRKGEADAFMFTLKAVISCKDRCRQKGYLNGDIESALQNRYGDLVAKTKELPSLDKWVEFMQGIVDDVQAAEQQKEEQEITYNSIFLQAIVSYMMSFERTSDGRIKMCMSIIQRYNNETYAYFADKYNRAEKELAQYIHPAKHGAVGIPSVTEEVEIPKKFPEKADILLGAYTDGFDADDGYPAPEEAELKNPELGEVVYALRDSLKEIQTGYKKLIYGLAATNRESNALALDFAAANEESHIAIHQPRYSETENKDKPLVELLEAVIYHFMNLFPKTSKRLAIIQRRPFAELAPFVHNIATEKNKYLVFNADDRSDDVVYGNAESFLKAMSAECDTVSYMLERTECRNLFEYNSQNYKNGVWKQLTLFIIKDFPLGFNEQSLQDFQALLGKANRFGIYVVMTVCDDLVAAMKEHVKSVDFDAIFAYFSKSFNLCARNGEYAYSLLSRDTYEKVNFGGYALRREKFRRERYFTDFELKMANANDPAIPLQSLFEGGLEDTSIARDERREKFFKVLRFPIGKEGTMPCYMELHQSGGGSPHVVISGTTGSGKSVLLQDIILSSMCCYTPEELEIYLFDFKETAGGFDIYKDHFFPHVKKIATECKDREITELLKMIQKIYRDRMKTVKDFKTQRPEVNNIIDYNAYARAHGMKQIPRMMVIIDEYQTITSEENINRLLEIAQKGREYGVVLIMASQSSSVNSFGNIIKLFGHRFEFKNEPIGVLIAKASSRAQELSGPHGLCFYSSGGSAMNPYLVRCAFVQEDKDLPEFINYIAKKYAAYPASTYKIGSVKREDIIRPAEYDEKTGFPALEDIARSGCKVFDGEAEGNAEWLQNAIKKANGNGDRHNAGYVLNLGLNSISLAPWEYKLEKKTPYLLAYGDALRVESLFYSAAKSVLQVAEKIAQPKDKPLVYYFNGNGKIREDSPLNALDYTAKLVKICPSEARAEEAVDELFDEYERRKQRADFLSAPILIMVSDFVSFIELFELDKAEPVKVTVERDENRVKANAAIYAKMFAENKDGETKTEPAPAAPPQTEAKKQDGKKKIAAQKFNALISADGARYGFFSCLQISDSSKNNFIKKHMEMSKVNAVVYLDSYEESGEENANIAQISTFNKEFLPDRRAKISVKDIKCGYAYVFTDDKTEEYIPYEYSYNPDDIV